jgi:hypothetical protein
MRPDGINALLPFVFADVRRGVIVVIGAYFDESLRQDGHEPIVVGGYLFKPAQYQRFRQRWYREVLRLPNRRQLKHFHMTDLCAGHGVYEGIDIPTRVGILERAVNVIGACAYGGLGVHFLQAEYEAAVAGYEWAKYRGSIYAQACGMCVQMTAYWLRQWRCDNAEVMYVFERGHKFQNNANDILSAIAGNEQARKALKYRQHIFEEKDSEYALQAADLFAWTMTKARSINGGPIPRAFQPFASEVIRLSGCLKGRQHLSVFTGEMLRRYLIEMGSMENGHIPVTFRPWREALR